MQSASHREPGKDSDFACFCRFRKLFDAYDSDQSGHIDAAEFLCILRMLDPSLEMEDLQRTFAGVGASDSLEKEQFWQWCLSLFGDFNDYEFEAQIEELMTAQSPPHSPHPPPLLDERSSWSRPFKDQTVGERCSRRNTQ